MTSSIAVEGLVAGYGPTIILDDVSFSLPSGSTLALLGRNGVGKTTLLNTLMGFTTRHRGSIRFGNRPVERMPPYRRNRIGFGYVPQEREIFASLSVDENLAISQRAGGWPVERVYDLFPSLKDRRRNDGRKLSGGEQQMLAIGRALVGAPKVLLLDEPMEGLAPVVVDALYDALRSIRDMGDLTIILVEQKAELALQLAERAIILDRGKIVYDGSSPALLADGAAQAQFLGVGAPAHGDATN
jgi:branched-chain amino acid transport system ATP-binding protein